MKEEKEEIVEDLEDLYIFTENTVEDYNDSVQVTSYIEYLLWKYEEYKDYTEKITFRTTEEQDLLLERISESFNKSKSKIIRECIDKVLSSWRE